MIARPLNRPALTGFLTMLLLGVAGVAAQEAAPLTSQPGDIDRGRQVVLRQDRGNCLLCHALPEPSVRFSGDIGPPLHGVGARLSPGQIRLRVMDASRLNPDTVMPPYHRTQDLVRVARQYQGRPVLEAQEVEDLVAYLAHLK